MKRTCIVGAGEAGKFMVRQLIFSKEKLLDAVCLLDDDKQKNGLVIEGVPVVGMLVDIEKAIEAYAIEYIVLAIPSLAKEDQDKIIQRAKKAGVGIMILPSTREMLSSRIPAVPRLDYQVLLDRLEFTLNYKQMHTEFSGKTVLITGAGGSIGSEIARQVKACQPDKIILVGNGEGSIYEIDQELGQDYSSIEIIPVIADIRNAKRVEDIFSKYKPDYVYHAAAHKHVPLMEKNIQEAIQNNVIGTYNVATAADKVGAKKVVMISTDKAVKPTNNMGASKRLAEKIIYYKNEHSNTDFRVVRFGNVLGSKGSVVPKFWKQICNNQKITLTHPSMTRYFMTIPEASKLVIQASALKQEGSIFILDMGKPVLIMSLIEKLFVMAGKEMDDAAIDYVGVRPGEKIHEQLFNNSELKADQTCDQIFVGKAHCEHSEWNRINFLMKNYHLQTEAVLKDTILSLANEGGKGAYAKTN
ncbi:polysaccharide biosynthesis protein [Listeria grandensis]|uniref:Polysaccharide biosynthesis protein n=1 Tax=Listeria grandensis TaxID=1494963 RepID=A0A7X0Y3R4_9LIST|nr:nucleoside-diphosphate sugar epimerase/dehydratase [Listeria grandensis]MBC1935852.1 polysaccharide biosynthesis protein [Listeria grandensis]